MIFPLLERLYGVQAQQTKFLFNTKNRSIGRFFIAFLFYIELIINLNH